MRYNGIWLASQLCAHVRISSRFLSRNDSKPLDTKWVADITFIRTGEGWLYLCAVLDLFWHKIVGWSMSPESRAGRWCSGR